MNKTRLKTQIFWKKSQRSNLNFPLYIAKRYLVSKSSNNAINIITLIATIGVIVSTIALFLVLSVFSGLKNFSLSFIQVSDPDLKVSAVQGKSFNFSADIEKKLALEKIVAFTKVIEERAFFNYHDKSHIAFVKGVDSNYLNVNRMDTAVYFGEWVNYQAPHTVVVGSGISSILSVGAYDFMESLKIFVPKPGKGYINNPNNAFNSIETQPIGIYKLTDEIDRKFVYGNLNMIQKLLNFETDRITAIEIKVENSKDTKSIQEELQTILGPDFKVQTRQQLNSVFYKMLNTENLASYLVFTLVLVIALFNVIGAIVMMIIDKRSNLKTMFYLGAEIKEIKRIFILQGFLLTLVGLGIGLLIAIPIVLMQKKFGLIMITSYLA